MAAGNTSLPSPPLLFIAIFTSHRSPLSERLEQANIPEQAVKKMRTGSAALSLPSPRAFFAFITERLSTTTEGVR